MKLAHPPLHPFLPTLLLACVAARAQGVVWGQIVPPANPGPRYQHAMAYDSARQRSVIYGGYNNSAGISDTWEWDGTNWAMRIAASAPGVRRWHTMAYDEARQRTVLFGGQGTGGSYPTDTWTWDGTTWIGVTVPGPGPRQRHAMAYDSARQRVVLFGGSVPGGSSWSSDTWEWDGTAWAQRIPATTPVGRTSHSMAYDAARQRMVVFGGQVTGSVYDNQTWTYDGSDWALMAPAASPSARIDTALAFDPSRQTVLLFGGYNINTLGYLRDTWEWNGTNWIQSTPSVRPSARSSHTMVYHTASQAVILHGGSPNLSDTWSTYLPASAVAYGAGCGSPALGFVPDPAARPRVGQTARADIVNTPPGLVGVAAGWSNTSYSGGPLPFPLDAFGMTGCSLLQSFEFLGFPVSPVTASTWSFPMAVPNSPVLLGKHFYLQAYVLDPASLPVVSNGIDWLFGNV